MTFRNSNEVGMRSKHMTAKERVRKDAEFYPLKQISDTDYDSYMAMLETWQRYR